MRKEHVGEFHETKEQRQERYAKNKEKELAYAKNWRDNHPDLKNYRKQYMREYLRKLKAWAVNKLGHKCHDCGLVSEFDCVYDFHHEGEDSWSKLQNNRSKMNVEKVKILREWQLNGEIPSDVILLCANCHRIRCIVII
jgi:hypothetical protein